MDLFFLVWYNFITAIRARPYSRCGQPRRVRTDMLGEMSGMIQSVVRAVEILRCFEDAEMLGVSEIAVKLGLNKSTAFGLVSTLASTGLLERDGETGRYRLGLELFRLGNQVNASLRRLVVQELSELSAQVEETVNFVQPEGGNVIYVVKQESPHSMRICTKIGQRLPMYCTAVGKAILAFRPEAEQKQIIRGFAYRAFTRSTVTTDQRLLEDLAWIRREGYAVEREELEYGLVCVAAPILDAGGRAIAAISCSGPEGRMTNEKIVQCRDALLKCAGRLAEVNLGL